MSGSLFVLGKFDDKELSLPNCQPRQSWACLSQRYKESGPLAALDYSSYPAGISPDTARAVLINYRNNQCRTPRGLLRLSVTPRCQEIPASAGDQRFTFPCLAPSTSLAFSLGSHSGDLALCRRSWTLRSHFPCRCRCPILSASDNCTRVRFMNSDAVPVPRLTGQIQH